MSAGNLHVAGVVVLFNPPEAVVANIRSYIDQIEILYVVDNSDIIDPILERELIALGKVSYLGNHGNPGQAHALNRGISTALEWGADFILTMDQDSSASPSLVSQMLAVLDEIPVREVGILAPFHLTKNRPTRPSSRWQEMFTIMLSGNLLNADAYRKTGPFLEELFLDYVDNEYCLRLRKNGFRIIQVNGALLDHSWGNMTENSFLGRRVVHLNYPPFRWYYIARNFCYVFSLYKNVFPETYRLHRRFVVIQAVYALIFEPCRLLKLKMMIMGLRDFRIHRLGKLEYLHLHSVKIGESGSRKI